MMRVWAISAALAVLASACSLKSTSLHVTADLPEGHAIHTAGLNVCGEDHALDITGARIAWHGWFKCDGDLSLTLTGNDGAVSSRPIAVRAGEWSEITLGFVFDGEAISLQFEEYANDPASAARP